MRRGRKGVGHELALQTGPFKCSECDFVSDSYPPAEEHVGRAHQGLARINGKCVQEEPMTRNEMVGWVKKAHALLKELTCSVCSKTYSSALGFVCHVELCGKTEEELVQPCEYCGKKLKVSSHEQHIRQLHSTKKEIVEEVETELTRSKRRKSAIIAKKNFAEQSDESDSESQPRKRGKKQPKADDDFIPEKEAIEEANDASDENYDDKDDVIDEDKNEDNSVSSKKIKKETTYCDRTIDKKLRYAGSYQNDLLTQLRSVDKRNLFEDKHFVAKEIRQKPLNYKDLRFPKMPLFKSTSMQAEGNNELQRIEPLKSIDTKKACYINVGGEVKAIAWCPQPLPDKIFNSSQTYLKTLKECESLPKPSQYVAILTTNHKNSDSKFGQYLQIWKFTPNNDCDNIPSNGVMQLFVTFTYGNVYAMQWCPNGATYQQEQDIVEFKAKMKISRMGLMAFACQDSCVRIVSIPHGFKTFKDDKFIVYDLPTTLVLRDREQFSPCTCLSWSSHYPYTQILGGFQNGQICLWNLNKIPFVEDDCETMLSEDVYPTRIFISPRRAVVNEIRWLNRDVFMTSHHDVRLKIWNLNIPNGVYSFFDRDFNIVQKIETHPTWYDSFILLDINIKRKNNIMITYKTLDGSNEYTALTHWKTIALNDMSLSPWQYVVAYGTANGSLHCTGQLKNPSSHQKKQANYTLFKTQLGDLKLHQSPAAESSKNTKRNELLNKRVDINFDSEDFFDKYYLIFNDQFQRKMENNEFNDTNITEHDADQVYSITNVEWCPNILSSDWLFCSTKTGICWISSQHIEQ